jgi:hypothetical protein
MNEQIRQRKEGADVTRMMMVKKPIGVIFEMLNTPHTNPERKFRWIPTTTSQQQACLLTSNSPTKEQKRRHGACDI